jgi:hypothetical protein
MTSPPIASLQRGRLRRLLLELMPEGPLSIESRCHFVERVDRFFVLVLIVSRAAVNLKFTGLTQNLGQL